MSAGEDLLHAKTAVYYRTKATYVLWMLRDLAGDNALQSALQAYNPAQDTMPDYFEHLLEKASHKDLRWFFEDWVNQDKGLPDLSIGGVYPSREAHDTDLVAIEIVNDGYCRSRGSRHRERCGYVRDPARCAFPAHGRITYRDHVPGNSNRSDVNDGTVPEVEASIHRKLLSAQ